MMRRPPSASPTPLRHWLRAAAAEHPAHAALIDTIHGRHLSYAALMEAVEASASRIREAGLQAGDRLGIAASRDADTLIWILAALDAGVAYVPFDLDYPPKRLAEMARLAGMRALVGAPAAVTALQAAIGPCPTLDAPAAASHAHAAVSDLSYVLFTSGSTGSPKGVAMGATPLAHLIDWHQQHPRLGQAARTLLFAPFAFDVHFQEVLGCIATGGTLVLIDDPVRRDPSRLLDLIIEHAIERVYLPYVALHMVADVAAKRPLPIRDVISAGEQLVLTPAIRRLFELHPTARLHNHYGPTESHVVTALTLPETIEDWPAVAPIGEALPHVDLVEGPMHDDGGHELWLSGDCLAAGYLGQPKLEIDRFIRLDDGRRAYCTGDLAIHEPGTGWRYLGRSDSQLKIDGFRIEPGEIEAALLALPGLSEAAVDAIDRHGVRSLAAWVVPSRESPAPDLPSIKRLLRESLPEAWVPLHIFVLASLPKTPSGKLDRRALPTPDILTYSHDTSLDPEATLLSIWREALSRPNLDAHTSVFDEGARSLIVLRVLAELKRCGLPDLGVADVYDYPTVSGQAAQWHRGKGNAKAEGATLRRRVRRDAESSGAIAIVGYAARVGDCPDAEAFRIALLEGRDGLKRFKIDELDCSVPTALSNQANFVPARGVLADADCFDARLFGIPAREATLIDPQQRLLLELAWTALEHAGIDSTQQLGIGVWAGTGNNSYAPMLRREAPQLIEQSGEFAAMLASEKDYVATRIAHRLNLDGPAISVHTACSTGLVAVAEAVEALRAGRCRVALAGGATVLVPQASGYLHVEGGMESADGQCRPFDADASGTVFASAGAMVALKTVEAALADGDRIHALIRGVGVNNDGGEKASFTAPSARGQAAAIGQALADADVPANTIGFIEAHGTATSLGDPIEVQALADAHGAAAKTTPCWLGSLKSNFGHTVAAAGVLGLLKASFAVRDGEIPGTRHFYSANPALGLDNTRFKVSAEAQPWPSDLHPRRAAVSSFGVGGTNAHLIIEAAPSTESFPVSHDATWRLLPLSAATPDALRARATDLADALDRDPTMDLASVQATLVRGRRPLPVRACVLASSKEDAINALRGAASGTHAVASPQIVWLLPGQGSQHVGMAARLYEASPIFAETLDEVLEALAPWRGPALRHLLLDEPSPESDLALADTAQAQPALFAMGVAMGRWLSAQGVRADAMIGHSIGDFTAACLSGGLALGDAARIVCARASAMAAQAPGAMAAVQSDAATLANRLPKGLDLAAINAPQLTVIGGPEALLRPFLAQLHNDGIESTPLRVSHAFHSASMDGALAAVREAFAGVQAQTPRVPTYSSLTGQLHTRDSLGDGNAWAKQVREPVRFADAITHTLSSKDTIFIELGPGQALSALARQARTADNKSPRVLPLLPRPNQAIDAFEHALSALGQLWCHGLDLEWGIPATAGRAQLPTYPFSRDRHWFPRASEELPARPNSALRAPSMTSSLSLPMPPSIAPAMNQRLPRLTRQLQTLFAEIAGIDVDELDPARPFLDQDFDSLTLTQAALEVGRVFGAAPRLRQLMEDLDHVDALAKHLDALLPPDVPRAPSVPAEVGPPELSSNATVASGDLLGLMSQQLALMQQTLALVSSGQVATIASAQSHAIQDSPPERPVASDSSRPYTAKDVAAPVDLVAQPFGASARIILKSQDGLNERQSTWLRDFIARYLQKTGRSREYSQAHRAGMADPRVVTGFNPQWKDLVYPIVTDRSNGACVTDIDGNEYIDLLSCFGANLLGYQPEAVTQAMHAQLDKGIEVGPQHPLAGEVAKKIAAMTGHERVAFCNTGSEAVMGAMRMARTVTGRKTIAIFTNSYHGIFDEVIVRGTRQLRSLAAAPGILANAVENVLVLDYASDDSLRVLRERGHELAAIMIEPVQNKLPTLQPKAFVESLRRIADEAGCALIFDEVVTGFRLGSGGAQAFYGVRADLCTYGKIIGGGLPLAAIAGGRRWMDSLDGGDWQFGDDSFPEAGVTYFAGTFVRHPLALAAANATLDHLIRRGPALYSEIDGRTQRLIDRLNKGFVARNAPVEAVHCASLWRLKWDDGERFISLFYYLARFHGLHVYEQFGHFVTEAMTDAVIDRIGDVYLACLDELMGLELIRRRDGESPTPTDAAAPLTPGQAERWLAAQVCDEALSALNETLQITLDGPIDVDALTNAVTLVQSRHAAFRTALDAERPNQRVLSAALRPLQVTDLRNEAQPELALERACDAAGREVFRLGEGPMVGLHLFRCSDTRHRLQMTCSHLVLDGWAASTFVDEIAKAYQALLAGRSPSLPEAGSPRQFANDLQALFSGPAGENSAHFWKQALTLPPNSPQLGDRRPSGARNFAANTARWKIASAQWAELKAKAKAARLTPFQWLFATVADLVARESGQSDLIIGVPYAGQALGKHPALMADGVLELPVRVSVDLHAPANARRETVRAALADALDHPLMTQGLAARLLALPPRADLPPLTGILFNLNPRIPTDGFAPLTVDVREGAKIGLLGELMFNFHDEGETLSLELHYATEFFSDARISTLIERLAHLIDIQQLPIDSIPAPRVEALLAEQAERTPEHDAIRFGETRWTYRTLDERANRIARELRDRGVKHGDWVGLCLPRQPNLVAALLGILKAGAAYVPLDPSFPLQRLRDMAEDAGLCLLLTDQENAARLNLVNTPNLCLDLDEDAITQQSGTPLSAVGDQDAAAYVIYTSGSTGKPKGVVVGHAGVVNFLKSMAHTPGLGADDRLLAVTTLSFDISVLELLLPLSVGATVILASRDEAADGESLKRLIQERGITVMQATPSTWHVLLESGFRAPDGFRALCGGEALSPALARRLLGANVTALWNLYGPTETTVWSTVARITDPDNISVGRPIDATYIRLLDENGADSVPGASGEICIGGAGLAKGYHARPELTADRFILDRASAKFGARLYRTGDLGTWNADGSLRHLGRLDHQVKLRGFRIELGEIESALEDLPAVARAALSVESFGPMDDRLVAHVVGATGHTLPNLGSLRRALSDRLPDYMLPQQVRLLDAMPLLPNGKIDRKALNSKESIERTPDPAPTPPDSQSDMSRRIGALMGRLLQRAPLADGDHFFELGGHSLLAAELASGIKEMTGRRPNLRLLFEAPTPSALASRLQAQDETPQGPALQPRADRSSAPLSLQQQRAWFLECSHPGNQAHRLPSAHRLRGPLDLAAFQNALNNLVERHSSLRTVFKTSFDGAEQSVLDAADVACPLIDLGGLATSTAMAEISAQAITLQSSPIDLGRDAPFLARLYRLADDDHVFVFIVHHLVWDGWSFDVLYKDFSAFYAAALAGTTASLPALQVDYGDFCVWQQASIKAGAMTPQIAHWKSLLSPLPPRVDLPFSRKRPKSMTGRGASVIARLPSAIVNRLHGLASRNGTTLFVVLLTAYSALIEQLTMQKTIVVGVPVRGREHPALLPLTGFFVNALPLVLRRETSDLSSRLHEVKAIVADALGAADVPIEDLVRELGLPRDTSRATLFDLMFSFQDARERPASWGPLKHERVDLPITGATHDLNLWCVETSSELECVMTYSTDLLDAPDVERMLATYIEQLTSWSADGADTHSIAPSAAETGQQLLKRLWSELLHVKDIADDDNFFELGGHSLLALTMVSRVELACGKRLSLLRVGDSSLRALAATLAETPIVKASSQNEHDALASSPRGLEPVAKRSWLKRLLDRR